jgi:putative membrane-bound dehydrogenase-like protein
VQCGARLHSPALAIPAPGAYAVIHRFRLIEDTPIQERFMSRWLVSFWSRSWALVALAGGLQAAEPALITWETKQLSEVFFSEGADAGDFNNDGHMDVISGPFWYAGPEFAKGQPYYEPKPFDPLGYSDNFFAYTDDFNADGWTDILIYGFPHQDASWYENPQGQERLWERHKVLDIVDNESPTFVDITGDGRRDIVCSREGFFGFAEVNSAAPTEPWTFRHISDQSAGGHFTHGLGVGDVNGDGNLDILEKNGWWEQPASLEGDPVWTKHAFQFSQNGGAQMYAFDIDGDGDNDVLTSLWAHGYGLAWYENTSRNADAGGEIAFTQHLILGEKPEDNPYGVCFSQLHGVDVADINGDGLLDIVTGKRWWAHGPNGDAEPNASPVLYWLELTRKEPGDQNESKSAADLVDFVPHLIHDNSGIGVEVKARDLNGDGLLDVVVGNKKGTFVSIQSRAEATQAEFFRHQPRRTEDAARAVSDGLPPNDGLEPEAAAAAMTVPAGFRVQLAAGEPLVHQPVAFTIDERGRLWVAEAHTYPQRAPAGEGKDRIIILEDADLDGTFENRKVFIEGLNLVSGIEVGFGGLWVGAAPYLMFIPDHNRDDVPDGESSVESPVSSVPEVRRRGDTGPSTHNTGHDLPPGATVLLDGFGYEDTHETLNSFIWGPDGWLYGCHGVFTHSRVGKPGTPDEDRIPLNCCVWRYHPTRHEFETFANGTSNPWGVDFDDHGQAIITACVIPHMFHMIQGGRYTRQGGQHFNPHTYDDIETIADHAHYAGNIRDHAWWGRDQPVAQNDTHAAGGGHAHCGAMIYLGDNWPTQYRNTIFMANIHGNRVNNDILTRDGSGFIASHGKDFLFANDRWFRGINLKYGPDGSVYLIDWYDPNACHRNQPEIWDRTNGRIYRISYGDVQPQKVDLSHAMPVELVGYQLHENDWYVRTARRLLQQGAEEARHPDPNAGVSKFAVELSAAELQLHQAASLPADTTRRLRSMWALHSLHPEGLTPGVTLDRLRARGPDSEYIRAWGIQLETELGPVEPEVEEAFVHLAITDPSPVVRLYLASGLQRLPLEQRWTIARNLLKHAEDVKDHNLPLMYWYGIEPLVPADPDRALALAAESQIPLVTQYIYRRAAADSATLPKLLAAIGSAEGERQALMLGEVMNVVEKSGQLEMPANWPEVYERLSQHENFDIRRQAMFITVKFGDKSIFPALRSILLEADGDEAKLQAIAMLVAGKDPELPPILHDYLGHPTLRSTALKALATFDHPDTPAAILERYPDLDEVAKQDAITTLASREAWALALLDAIEKEAIPRADLKAFTIAQMQALNSDKLLARITEVWGSVRSTPAERLEQIAALQRRLTPAELGEANLPHGRELYAKTCAKCHKLFGDGGAIGPDITGSNRANLEYILGNIYDPSALVGKDYQTTSIVTLDGRALSGLIKEENDTAIVLQTATDVVVVDKADIEIRKLGEQSLMPEGQLKEFPPDDIRDLIAYLASPRQVPLPGEGPYYDEQARRVAGAIEGEAMTIVSTTSGSAGGQGMSGFSADHWSGDSQLWWTGGEPGAKLTLSFDVREAGDYEVYAVMTKARDYGIVDLTLDGKPVGGPIDLFNNPEVITTGPLNLGTHTLTAGEHQLTIEVRAANPAAVKAYMFGLDYLYLSPKSETSAEPIP